MFFSKGQFRAREPPVPDFETENKSKFGGIIEMRNYKCNAMMIGQRLKEARMNNKTGMTQLNFAEEIGVYVSNISKIEQGLRLPSIEILYEYMNHFDVDANQLLGCDPVNRYEQVSIDNKIAALPNEAREYLTVVILEMINRYPR